MKKLLLSVVFAMVALTTTFAANLNPFAYGLKSTYDPLSLTLSGEFMLNAPATSVAVYAIDAGGRKYLLRSYGAANAKGRISFEYDLMALHIPQGVDLNWCVEVTGAAVASPTFVKNDVRLYAPTSVDIDNNPENANFGTVFCIEGRNGAYQASNYSSYISYEDGAGLYLLNADGTARKMPFQTEKVRYGYNGGVVNQPNRNKPFFGNNGTNDLNGYNAFRVRVSDDGRIFVTAFSIHGHVLWEAKKECFSATTQAEWSANTGWHEIITKDNANTFMANAKRDCSTNHQYCGIYSLYEGNATSGQFIAGPNLGFDVRGSGDNLKLLMLAGCQQAIVWSTPEHFYCDEYDLGTATLWNTAPSRRIFAGHSKGVDIVNPQGVQVQYDKSGNVWVCQYRAVTDNITLARVNRALSSTKVNNVNEGQVDYSESSHTFRRCGAIRFNEDFTQVAIASNEYGNGGGFTVYPVNASTGMPIWEEGTKVNTYNKTGASLMDFAWDYAGNLYMAADAATNGERIAVYAMPHAADRVVSTPAASKYAFTVSCQADKQCTVNTVCNPEVGGTIVCSVEGNVRTGELTLESCTELTVTATPEDGYKFLNWTDGNDNVLSTNKEFTFYVTEDITLKANFEYATYTGVVWKSLFLNGEDIAVSSENKNTRLWRLLQVQYNEDYPDQLSKDANGYHQVYYFFDSAFRNGHSNSRETIRTNLKTFVDSEYGDFYWLGKYIENLVNVGDISNNSGVWGWYLQAFINRINGFLNADCNATLSSLSADGKTYPGKDFSVYGQPQHWRPYWAEDVCNLPMIMKYSDDMPTISTWTRPSCPSGSIAGVTPSSWYKWNIPANNPAVQDVPLEKYFILAWRANSPTGDTIVHHVYRNNMELHASYVLKNIDENDAPANPTNYDASNEDVIKLMQNPNFDPEDGSRIASHDFTVTRKLQKGMYNTICMPLSIDINGLMDTHHLKNATVLQFSGVTTKSYNDAGEPVTVLNFTEIQENGEGQKIIEKGVPYLIMVDEDVTEETLLKDMPFTGVARDNLTLEAQNSETIHGITFHGTINPTNIPEGSLILVANNRLALTTAEGGMAGMRGYFTIDPMQASDIAEQAADGRVYLSFQKPTTTSIPVAPEAEQQKQPKVRKVMHNGQIYILRGDEVYTITGHRVK